MAYTKTINNFILDKDREELYAKLSKVIQAEQYIDVSKIIHAEQYIDVSKVI